MQRLCPACSMTERIPLQCIKDKASERPPGYYEDCLSRGTVSGDFLELSMTEYLKLCADYPPMGAGDVVAMVAEPIAGVLRMAGCGGCNKRRKKLNRAMAFR